MAVIIRLDPSQRHRLGLVCLYFIMQSDMGRMLSGDSTQAQALPSSAQKS